MGRREKGEKKEDEEEGGGGEEGGEKRKEGGGGRERGRRGRIEKGEQLSSCLQTLTLHHHV